MKLLLAAFFAFPLIAQVLGGITPEQVWTILLSLTAPTVIASILKLVRDNVPGITIVGVVVPLVGVLVWLGTHYLGMTLTGNMWVDFILQVVLGYVTSILSTVKRQLEQGLTRTVEGTRKAVGFLGTPKS
jgi:hypothetical protein